MIGTPDDGLSIVQTCSVH